MQFNCGHWDAAHWDGDDSALTTVEEYGRNVRKIIHRIRRYWSEAKIVFASTTPMNPSGEFGRKQKSRYDFVQTGPKVGTIPCGASCATCDNLVYYARLQRNRGNRIETQCRGI